MDDQSTHQGSERQKIAFGIFLILIFLQYARPLVNLIANLLYRPKPIPQQPLLTPRDCTVIIPTIGVQHEDHLLHDCVCSILQNYVHTIIIVTAGEIQRDRVNDLVGYLRYQYPETEIHVGALPRTNKRRQIAHAIEHVITQVTVLVEDYAAWPRAFLPLALAPFSDSKVGGVGTNKRLRRRESGFNWDSFWCFLRCVSVERTNYEATCNSVIDRSASFIDNATAFYRTTILKDDPEFLERYRGSYFFSEPCTPRADDDAFITRWLIARNWRVQTQASKETCIEVASCAFPRSVIECDRYVRSQWRSNFAMLQCVPNLWVKQPWSAFGIYCWGTVNYALFRDAAVLYAFVLTEFYANKPWTLGVVVAVLIAVKLIKPFAHFLQEPFDIVFVPGLVLFGYFHTVLKMKNLFTFFRLQTRPVDEEEDDFEGQIPWIWGSTQEMRVL
ncbi:hypothetical protein G7046_g6797 [Stylonectria norvegica]|nr:hypothetical protein G7046_g6797 [Stylonectria norvegica]